MARISKGILGGFSGKVGTVVGATWRGQDIIRSVPKASGKQPTEKQLQQQMKFKLAVSFLQPLKNLQAFYFGSNSGTKSRLNLAVSYTLNQAVDMVADQPIIVYSKVLITKGDLAGFQNLNVQNLSGGSLQCTWDDNTVQGNASATDDMSVVAYCEELNEMIIYQNIAKRQDATISISFSALYVGKEVQLWAFFSNEAQTSACNSPYMGAQTIA